MQDFSIEELKTAIGHLMLDLRGNWGFKYVSRMKELCLLLQLLISKDPGAKKVYNSDLIVTKSELKQPFDGRIFRDECKLYGYSSELGKTTRVKDYLQIVLTHPENNQIKIDFKTER